MGGREIEVKSVLRSGGDPDIRIFPIPLDLPFHALHGKLKETYKLEDDDFSVKYKDQEGDAITVTNDNELATMFSYLDISRDPKATLKLYVHPHTHTHAHAHPPAGVRPQQAHHPAPVPPEEEARPEATPPLAHYRGKFSPEFSDREILDVLRDIGAYISARDPALAKSWVSSEKSLITPAVMSKIAATLPASEGKLVSKPKNEAYRPKESESVTGWNTLQVAQWLQAIGSPELQKIFHEHDVTGDVLLELDHEMLKDMGVISTGKRVRLIRAIENLKKHRTPRKVRHKSLQAN